MKISSKKSVIVAVIVIMVLGFAGAGAGWYFFGRAQGEATLYRTAEVKRADLVVSIAATGTVEPEEVVDVGAQVAGQIVSFGKDQSGKPIDYGSTVAAGMVLAQIDDSLYAADAAQATAALEAAKAGVVRAEADRRQAGAKRYQAERDWTRARKLGSAEAMSASDYDAFKANYDAAIANVAVAEAAIGQARAAVGQAEALLRRAERNLGYCTIRSPVNGVIIDRRVNIGQTVVSSLNAPSLFLIAKDLTRMQVWVSVNEADIGHIRPGQPVTFTVDAYPDRIFRGVVGKIRLNATMTQNVVTYTVELITDNADGKLLPYLTANVNFEVDRADNVLLVPRAALRWSPQTDRIVPEFRTTPAAGSGGLPDDQPAAAHAARENNGPRPGVVWVPEGNLVRPVTVDIGPSDGTLTEISGPEVREGRTVVIGDQEPAGGDAVTTNPFTPQLRGGGRPKR